MGLGSTISTFYTARVSQDFQTAGDGDGGGGGGRLSLQCCFLVMVQYSIGIAMMKELTDTVTGMPSECTISSESDTRSRWDL